MTKALQNSKNATTLADAPVDVRCSLCQSSNLTDFFELPEAPIFVCVLFDTQEEAEQAPTGQITLCYCRDCGFVFNRTFAPEKLDFKPGYDASLKYSQVFRRFMEYVADRQIKNFGLKGRDVIEVGCGEGFFLRLLAKRGGNRCVGFDPTIATPSVTTVHRGSVELIRDCYTSRHADLPCDFLCSLSVMEAIPRPTEFVANLVDILGSRSVGCYFEVFNGYGAIERKQSWSIHYEQCNYFSESTLAALFARSGLAIRDAGTCYENGEYLFVEAQSPAAGVRSNARIAVPGRLPVAIEQFSRSHVRNIENWNERFDDQMRSGRRAVVWGSGGKGVSFLNAFKRLDAIEHVVDINPNRQGKFVPGSGQKIISPDDLTGLKPDTIILTNPIYKGEITRQVSDLGLECEFLNAFELSSRRGSSNAHNS